MTKIEESLTKEEILKNIDYYQLPDDQLSLMARGKIPYPENFPTGYPSLDRTWLKYFEPSFLGETMPRMTIYDYMVECTKSHISNTAISYYGATISYGELYENIIRCSNALSSIGVENNDRIMYLMPNIPETAYMLYGTSRIGAVADFVDPRPDSIDKNISAQKILKMFIREKCKYIVALDQCYLAMLKPIEKELKELGLEQIIVVSATDSMDKRALANYIVQGCRVYGFSNFIKKLKRTKMIGEMVTEARSSSIIDVIDYKDLVANSMYTQASTPQYQGDKLTLITHTSGTTSSMPKPVPATHDNMNAFAHQSFGAKMSFAPGYRVLHILPYFASFGVTDVVHAGLCNATTLVEIPEVEIDKFGKLVYLNKGEIVVGLPCWLNAMKNDCFLKGKDLSFLKYVSYGGTGMEPSDEIEFNEFIHQHGATINLAKGHGLSETEGCSSNATDKFNELGSIGIPMPKTIYAIVDPETKEPLRFKSSSDVLHGEIAIASDAVSSCELDGLEYAKFVTIFGKKYLLTGDLGTMQYDGTMYFDSRIDRAFPRYDGFNVRTAEIEKIIKQDPRIKQCIIVPYYDEEKLGNMIKANIVLSERAHIDDPVSFIKELVEDLFIKNENVSSRQIPSKFLIRTEIPLTINGKENYILLTEEGLTGEEISVIFDETNISIDSIRVQGPKIKKRVLKK